MPESLASCFDNNYQLLTRLPPPRPHGKFLVLSKDDEDKSRYLIGREIMGLMGIPINRMVGLDDTSESAFCLQISNSMV